MLPVLFSFGPIVVSSFGFFLAAGFLLATFLVWRLSRAWELDREKVLDLIILTFFGGFIGSRIFFVLIHPDQIPLSLSGVLLVNRYPGLSFWGGVLGGWLTLYFLVRRMKMDFWQVADIAAVGFLGGLILGDLGCFLGGCDVGSPTNLFFGVNMAGLIGKRFPIQAIEAVLALFLLVKIWPQAVKFHWQGKIISSVLIWVGIIKFLGEFFRGERGIGFILSLGLIFLGGLTFYSLGKRNLRKDVTLGRQLLVGFFTRQEVRRFVLAVIKKSWYNLTVVSLRNLRVKWSWRFYILKKKILRRINVKPTPKDFKYH